MNAILEQINSAGEAFVDFALPMLVQSGILILILLLIDFLLRRKVRAVFRYWIWMLVLAKLVLPTWLSSPLSLGYLFGDRLTSLQVVPTSPQTVEQSPIVTTPIIDLSNIPTGKHTTPTMPTRPSDEPILSKPLTSSPVSSVLISWQGVVFLLWLAVVIAMGLLLLQRAVFVRRLVAQATEADTSIKDTFDSCCERIGIRKRVGLKVSANATSPAVCGLFRPVILLPQNLSPNLSSGQLQAVLLHELAHIKRGDLWINLAQTILQILYFYNPLLWIANAIIRRIREQAVDEAVLVAMGETAQQYPETLVNVAKLTFKQPVLSLRLIGVVESKSALSGRIKHILNRPIPKTTKLGIVGILAIIIIAAVLLPMAKAKEDKKGAQPKMGFVAKLPNGVTVELLCLYYGQDSKNLKFWKPDGSLISDPDGQKYRETVIFPGWANTDFRFEYGLMIKFDPLDNLSTDVFVKQGQRMSYNYPKAEGIAVALVASDRDDRKGGFPKVGNIKVAGAYGPWDTHEFSAIINEPSVRYLNDKSKIMLSPVREDGERLLDITINTDNIDLDCFYQLKDGSIHHARNRGTIGQPNWIGPEQRTPLTNEVYALLHKTDEIENYIIKCRKSNIVEFKNVSLRPGVKTDVQVEVEGNPQKRGSALAIGTKEEAEHRELSAIDVVKGFMAAALSGEEERVGQFVSPRMPVEHIRDFQQLESAQDLRIAVVYYAGGKNSLAVASVAEKEGGRGGLFSRWVRNVARGRRVFLFFSLEYGSGGWRIYNINFRKPEECEKETERFYMAYGNIPAEDQNIGSKLEFRIVPNIDAGRQPILSKEEFERYCQDLQASGPDTGNNEYKWVQVKDKLKENFPLTQYDGQQYILACSRAPYVMLPSEGWGLQRVYSDQDEEGRPMVCFWFDRKGGELFYNLTKENLENSLAILIDDKVFSAPTIQTAIRKQAIIAGNFSEREVEKIAISLQKGMPTVKTDVQVEVEKAKSELEGKLIQGFRENRDKFECGVLAWSGKSVNYSYSDSNDPRRELAGQHELWWDGKKIATKYVQDQVYTDSTGRFWVDKQQGGNSYDGSLLSRKPRFNYHENWFGPTITRWRGQGSRDWLILEGNKRENIRKDWSVVDTNGVKLIRLMTKNMNETDTDYRAYSIEYYDPSKGYGLVNEEWYNSDGSPRMKHTVKLQEVIPGGWFPVEVDFKSVAITDGRVYVHQHQHYELDMERCSFNDRAAIPEGIFKGAINKQLKEQDKLTKVLEEFPEVKRIDGLSEPDRKGRDARETAETFVAMALAGEYEKAREFAHPTKLPDDHIKDIHEAAEGQNLKVMAVYADAQSGLAICSVIRDDRGRMGPLVLHMVKVISDGKENWSIHDIDMITVEETRKVLGKFLKEHLDAVMIAGPKTDVQVEVEQKKEEQEQLQEQPVIRAVDNKATLRSGLSIELLGVTHVPVRDQPWWKPDGLTLEEPLFDWVDTDPSKDPNRDQFAYYAVAIRLDGSPPDQLGLMKWNFTDAVYAGATGAYVGERGLYAKNIHAAAAKFSKGIETTTLHLGIVSGEWQTLFVGSHYGFYEKDGDSVYVSTPEIGGGLGLVGPDEKGLHIAVTYNITDRDFRVVAVDKEGKLHISSRSGSGGTKNLYRTTASFPDLTREQLQEYRFQVRQYEWVEFKDISLRPGKEAIALYEKRKAARLEEIEKWLGQGQTRQIRQQILILRQCPNIFLESEKWATAIRELVTIGRPAVPELIAELHRSERRAPRTLIAFTLRAISDSQAVSALIEELGRSEYKGEYALNLKDKQLAAFIQKYQDRPPRAGDDKVNYVIIGCPVIEITSALEKITGHTEGHEHFGHKATAELGRDATHEQWQQRVQEIVQETAERWQKWWDQHKDEFISR